MAPAAAKRVEQKETTAEYVGGGNTYYGGRYWGGYGDDFQPTLTEREIERARRDDEVSSSVEFLIDSIFADGLQIVPSVHADDPEIEKAQEIADFCRKAVEAAKKSFLLTIRNQFRAAFYHGLKVAEIVLCYANDSRFENKLILDRVNLKPLAATAFVTDEFDNVLGLVAAQDARRRQLRSAADLSEDEIIPLEKFQILSFEHDDNSPLGLTQIKAAYESLCDKYLTRIQYKDWRKKNAATQKFFTTPEKAQDVPEIDPNTGETLKYPNGKPRMKSAQRAILEAAATMENNSAMAAPFGSIAKQFESFGTGEQFERSFKLNNNGIRKSILGDALATGAADKDARAARQSSMDVVGLRVKSYRNAVGICIKRDTLTLLTRANYEEKYWHLVPDAFLGDSERREWSTDLTAARGAGYTFAKKHLPELDKQFGLDPRDEDDESMQPAPEVDPNADPNDGKVKKNSGGSGKADPNKNSCEGDDE